MDNFALEAFGAIGAAIITIIGSLVMYTLKKQNEDQQRQINGVETRILNLSHSTETHIFDLLEKHHIDVDRLHKLEVETLHNSYSKEDINQRFEEQRIYFSSRFDRLERLIDDRAK